MNGKRYVGKTIRSIEQRWREHVRNALTNHDEMVLYAAIRKYGPDSFQREILEEHTVLEDLNSAEVRLITELGTFRVEYNMTKGGDGPTGFKHTEDAKRRMSEARKGEKNHNFGKSWGKMKWSSEEIEALKKKLRANPRCHLPRTEEDKRKIGESQYVKIDQLDMNGNFIASYESMIEAEAKTGIMRQGISRCCRFPHRSAKGFRFRYFKKE